MASKTHMATAEDDARHAPGPESKPLWNESYWFTFVEPRHDIGFAARFGMLPNMGYGNLYLLVSQGNQHLYGLIDQRAKLPDPDGPLTMSGYTITVEKPRERFRLTFESESCAFDLVWESDLPTGMWPHPQVSIDQATRHIEHSGRVKGTLRVGAETFDIDCLAHRDHSFGGERNWNSFEYWDYLSGEFEGFWFNAVRIRISPIPQEFHIGCLWDGEELHTVTNIEMDVHEVEGGTRATGVDLVMKDEKGREHRISGQAAIASGNVWFGPTCLREGYNRWTYGDRVGYGVHEHGYTERND